MMRSCVPRAPATNLRCLVALLLGLGTQAKIVAISDTVSEPDVGDDSTYHPEHPPIMVTRMGRLHRSDGVASLLEAETEWVQGAAPRAEKNHLHLPPNQAKALLEYHVGASQAHSGRTRSIAESIRAGLRATQRKRTEEISSFLRSGQTGNSKVTMPLVLRGSEYIGPMGVGTIVGRGCMLPPSLAAAQTVGPQMPGLGHGKLGFPHRGSFLEADEEVVEEASFEKGAADTVNSCALRAESTLNVVYDTGSTNMWIASDLCEFGGCVLPERRRFNHTQSATFAYPEANFHLTVRFGTGKLSGPLGTDDVRIGPLAARHTFAMVETQTGSIWDEIPIEGIVGLAFPSMATVHAPPFFDSVIQQKVLRHNEFAFYLSRENDAANALMWGGVDPAFYEGKIEYFPVVRAHYWALELYAFKIGNETWLGGTPTDEGIPEEYLPFVEPLSPKEKYKKHVAVLDSGTTFLGAPTTIVAGVQARLPVVPCNEMTSQTHPPITFVLRNNAGQLRDMSLDSSRYMARTEEEGGGCVFVGGFLPLNIPSGYGPGMVLGDSFLREWFTVHDRGDGSDGAARVGLATAVPTARVQSRLAELTREQKPLLRVPGAIPSSDFVSGSP